MTGDVNKLCLSCLQYGLSDDGVCRFCGRPASSTPAKPYHLPPRSVLAGKYLVAGVLGEGGFGITYLGWDINLEMKVAIKEYYPGGFVSRDTTTTDMVSAYTGDAESFFYQGRDRFVEEARKMARFHYLPGIVTVRDFFLENGTAYIVMEFVEGITLKELLERQGGRMAEAQLLPMMQPLMRSLAEVHRDGIIHRDISPDNIMVIPDGQLRLLDFGAAREFNDDNKSLSVLLKPGYAPEEQYRSRGKQGPWTDVYALSATMYRALEGQKPPESMERVMEDTLTGFSAPVSHRTASALLKGLAVRGAARWQSMDELYQALYGEAVRPVTGAPVLAAQPSAPQPQLASAPARPQGPPAAQAGPAPASFQKAAPTPGGSAAKIGPLPKKALPVAIVAAVVVVALVATLLATAGQGSTPLALAGSGSAPSSAQSAAPAFEIRQMALAPGAAPAWTGPDGPIVIGAALDLVRNNTEVMAKDVAYNDGILLAAGEINAAGGIHGHQIQYESIDSQYYLSSPSDRRYPDVDSAIWELENAFGAVAILAADDDEEMLLSFLEDAENSEKSAAALLPMYQFEFRRWELDESTYRGYSSTCSSPETAGRALASFAKNALGAQSVAILCGMESAERGQRSNQIGAAFLSQAGTLGLNISTTMEIMGNYYYSDEFEAEIREQVRTVAATGADVLVIPAEYIPTGAVHTELTATGFTGVLLTDERWDASQAEDAAYTVYRTSLYNQHDQSFPPSLRAALEEIPGHADNNNWYKTMLGYESLYLLASAINNAGTTDRDAIYEALRTVQWEGLSGKVAYSGGMYPQRDIWIESAEGVPQGRVLADGSFLPAAAHELPEGAAGAQAGATGTAEAEAETGEAITARHILIGMEPEGTRSQEEALKIATDLYEQLITTQQAGEDANELFHNLMMEYGEDPGVESYPDGYTFGRGQMVEPFETAAFALAEYEISPPVRTDYGYHIIQRLPYNPDAI